jgi:LPXTG-motif cell wall-anchored protein
MGTCPLSIVLTCLAAIAAAQTTSTEKIEGSATVVKTQLSGVVEYTEGNTLVARMPSGDLRTFTVKDTTKFIIDGKETPVSQLKPGTSLTATMVTTSTPIVERTTTNLTGTVWYVMGNTVILTLPDGKNKMYKAEPHYKFNVNGQEAEVSDLRKGMRISAEKIVEEPTTEVDSNTTVIGSAPVPQPVVAEAPVPAPEPVREAAAPAPVAPPSPAPVEVAVAVPIEAAPAPAPIEHAVPDQLPQTGSAIPLVGIVGLLFTGAGLVCMRRPD